MKKSAFLWLSLVLVAIVSTAYFGYFRFQIVAYLAGEDVVLLKKLIDAFYPRFEVESQRFPPSFFLDKADQFFIRLNLLVLVLALVWTTDFKSVISNLKVKDEVFLYSQRAFLILLLLFNADLWFQFRDLSKLSQFYDPLPVLVLVPMWPSVAVYSAIIAGFYASTIAWILGWKKRLVSVLSVLSFLILFAWLNGFEKIDHAYAPHLAVLFFCMLAELVHKKQVSELAIALARTAVVLPYFMAGIEKVLTSQFTWIQAESMIAYLKQHPTSLGNWLSQFPMLLTVGMILALTFQLLSPLALFRRFGIRFSVGAFFFHAMVYASMGVGHWAHPWLACWALIALPSLNYVGVKLPYLYMGNSPEKSI